MVHLKQYYYNSDSEILVLFLTLMGIYRHWRWELVWGMYKDHAKEMYFHLFLFY